MPVIRAAKSRKKATLGFWDWRRKMWESRQPVVRLTSYQAGPKRKRNIPLPFISAQNGAKRNIFGSCLRRRRNKDANLSGFRGGFRNPPLGIFEVETQFLIGSMGVLPLSVSLATGSQGFGGFLFRIHLVRRIVAGCARMFVRIRAARQEQALQGHVF